MKEPLESSPVEHALQDKKNYASESASKSISANNSSADSTTIVDKKQTHIAETTNFFEFLQFALQQNPCAAFRLLVYETRKFFFRRH